MASAIGVSSAQGPNFDQSLLDMEGRHTSPHASDRKVRTKKKRVMLENADEVIVDLPSASSSDRLQEYASLLSPITYLLALNISFQILTFFSTFYALY